MSTRIALAALAVVAALSAAVPASAGAEKKLDLSNKWRVECSEGANSDGTILFRVTPKDGTPTEVAVAIKDGRSENGVARDIRDGFKAALDPKGFKVEVDDGEDVLVKRRSGTPNFELKLVESTVKAVRLHVQKE
jgi:hypothetical protein